MIEKSVSLHCKNERSDKMYYIQIISVEDNKFIVGFQYGRRGKNVTWGTKSAPTSKWNAEYIFDKKLQEELKKGYIVVPDDPAYMMVIACSY